MTEGHELYVPCEESYVETLLSTREITLDGAWHAYTCATCRGRITDALLWENRITDRDPVVVRDGESAAEVPFSALRRMTFKSLSNLLSWYDADLRARRGRERSEGELRGPGRTGR